MLLAGVKGLALVVVVNWLLRLNPPHITI